VSRRRGCAEIYRRQRAAALGRGSVQMRDCQGAQTAQQPVTPDGRSDAQDQTVLAHQRAVHDRTRDPIESGRQLRAHRPTLSGIANARPTRHRLGDREPLGLPIVQPARPQQTVVLLEADRSRVQDESTVFHIAHRTSPPPIRASWAATSVARGVVGDDLTIPLLNPRWIAGTSRGQRTSRCFHFPECHNHAPLTGCGTGCYTLAEPRNWAIAQSGDVDSLGRRKRGAMTGRMEGPSTQTAA
jgi:hypothetical protein